MSNIIVLAGGTSGERDVSLRSGAAVTSALQAAGHTVQQLDPADGLMQYNFAKCDAVFPVLHGVGGEDGGIQAQLDDFGVRYIGSDRIASELCFDKWQYKQVLSAHNIKNAAGALVDEAAFWTSELIKAPFVLKPNDGGSSIDTVLIRDTTLGLNHAAFSALFSRHPQMLLEQLIVGMEITVAVLGDQALPVIEIIPPASGEFDYENKYNGQSQELCPPVNVTAEIQADAQNLALQIHQLTACRDFSRTDIMIAADSQLYVLETNTIPGMTNQSLFPKAAATAGISMEQLVDRLVSFAVQR